MATISIEEAQANLSELIHRLVPGEELVITEHDRPVAKLVTTKEAGKKLPRLGTLRGTVQTMAHFDDPLEEFEEFR